MKKCEFLILPSIKEGFPISILEAFSCGKPVISTRDLHDIINGAGITINPKSFIELAEALMKILNDKEFKIKAGLIGRSMVESKWSWNIVGSKTILLYYSIKKIRDY